MNSLGKPPALKPRQLRLPRVCVVVTGSSPAEMLDRAEQLTPQNTFLEFRLDYLAQPLSILPRLQEFLALHRDVVAIATCRRAAAGGKFKGPVAAQAVILEKAVAAGCHLFDIELQSASRIAPAQLAGARERAAMMLSYHDFDATKDLETIFAGMQKIPADYYKLVTTATSLRDNVAMMRFLEQHSDRYAVVGLCMGEQGLISRMLGLRAGSVFTFAAPAPGLGTAPGQIAAHELRSTFRIEQLDAATRVYGVAGNPVAHSLSPVVMNAAMRRESVNAIYLPLHARTLKDLLACMRDIPLQGVSITMPYKESIIEHLENTDPQTSTIGACNTVVRAQDGKFYGFNTDMAGVLRPLEQRIPLPGAKILVLGAGGAARAAVFGLKTRGAEVFILNRTADRAQKLARQAKARTLKRPELLKQRFDAILNATPVGMGRSGHSPLTQEEIRARFVFDFVYDAVETPLLRLARAAGADTIPGIEMFASQAAAQFEIWTGKPAPVEDMLQTAITARQRAENNKDRSEAGDPVRLRKTRH